MPEGVAADTALASAPERSKHGKAFLITEVRWEALGPADNDGKVHVEAVEKDGYMRLSFDLATFDYALRPNDILYVDMEGLYAASWPPPVSISRGKLAIDELTLTMPSLAEREMLEFNDDFR
jgi:hypothetical protein